MEGWEPGQSFNAAPAALGIVWAEASAKAGQGHGAVSALGALTIFWDQYRHIAYTWLELARRYLQKR